jgi:hypothetical protein
MQVSPEGIPSDAHKWHLRGLEQLPSGHYRARYIGPDGRRYKAPTAFLSKADARGWLALRQSEIARKAWTPPEATPKVTKVTFTTYADQWMAHRPLKERTREHYRKLLDQQLIPAFGSLPLSSITSDDVRGWHSRFGTKTPTVRSHSYGLLRTILGTAVSDGKISLNPCVIRGAGATKRVHKIRPASLSELETIAKAMPVMCLAVQKPLIVEKATCYLSGGADPLAAALCSGRRLGGDGGRAPNTRVARRPAKVVTADTKQPFPPPATQPLSAARSSRPATMHVGMGAGRTLDRRTLVRFGSRRRLGVAFETRASRRMSLVGHRRVSRRAAGRPGRRSTRFAPACQRFGTL